MARRLELWLGTRRADPADYTDDFVWDMSRSGLLGQRHWHGAEGIDAFVDEWVGSWEDWSLEVDRIREGKPGQVVTECTQRGKADGVPVEMHFAQLWTLNDDGRATSMRVYLNVDEALAEAGVGSA